MSVRAALRTATREEHDAVDILFSRFDLTDKDGYRDFLAHTWAAFAPVERAVEEAGAAAMLEDWSERRRADLLAADIADLRAPRIRPVSAPPLATRAEIFGAVYVLEGSRLGAALLRRSLSPSWPARFMNASVEPGSWPRLIATLETALARPEDQTAAIGVAKAVFRCFEAAGQENRECVEHA